MKYLAIIVGTLFSLSAKAISVPCATVKTPGEILSQRNITFPAPGLPTWLPDLKPRAIRSLTGRKLNLKEKIAFALIKHKIKKQATRPAGEKITDEGKTAFILGLAGAITLLIPYLIVASIPLAILAIVIGNKAKRANPYDKKARAAVFLGIATLGVLVVVGLIVAVVLTIGQFPR